MTPEESSRHLSDVDIDAYWTGRLGAADEERVERHYLDCAACRERVGAVEALVDALRLDPAPALPPAASVRAWQLTAAVLATVATLATWQWARLARDGGVNQSPPAVVRTDGSTFSTLRVAIEPPTRSASATEVTLPSDVSIVIFDVDAREAGAPLTLFDVLLTDSGGRLVMRVQARSSAEGRIDLPVHRSLLEPGAYQFDLTHEGATVALPLLIHQSIQQP